MRISTSAIHNAAIDGMMTRQVELSRTQQQVTTGKRIALPADDPIGAVHILELQKAQSELDQFSRNSDAALARLNTEEQALADTSILLQRVRELAIQANNAPIDSTARSAISTELTDRLQSLVDIANRRDGAGEYLFSGYATTTQPFTRSVGGVNYMGDQGTRYAQVGATQRVADGHSGDAVFQRIIQGNGTFVTGAASTNTGTGIINDGSVANSAAWVTDNYTLTFTSATTYQVTNSAAAVVTSGTYATGTAIAFNGAQVSVTGAPATGDTFSINASQNEDVFTTIQNMITALQTTADVPRDRALLSVHMNKALAQLDQADNHVLNIRTEVGARLSTLDDTKANREAFGVEVQRNLSNLQDVDYAEAISRMNREMLGLQAAQQAYSKIQQLSLFNYL